MRFVLVGMRASFSGAGLLALTLLACSSSSSDGATSPPATNDAGQPDAGPAPTYTELFNRFFAPGTPGHCATMGCHADPGHDEWLCGTTKDACYTGMVQEGLIDKTHPEKSPIADPMRSPLTWVNSAGGDMPLDAKGDNAAARDAITAWVAAGAQNN